MVDAIKGSRYNLSRIVNSNVREIESFGMCSQLIVFLKHWQQYFFSLEM